VINSNYLLIIKTFQTAHWTRASQMKRRQS